MHTQNLRCAWALTLFSVTACVPAATPSYVSEHAALPIYPGDATPGQIQAAIVRAGAVLGWQMQQVGPEEVRGTRHTGGSHDTVQIYFGRQHYKILYRRREPAVGTTGGRHPGSQSPD